MLYDKRWELDKESKLLLKAADYIEEHGWCQHSSRDDAGRVCILGALRSVPGGGDSFMLAIADRLYARMGGRAVIVWNDMPGRTKDEVVAMLRTVALSGKPD